MDRDGCSAGIPDGDKQQCEGYTLLIRLNGMPGVCHPCQPRLQGIPGSEQSDEMFPGLVT